ncbi:hypothetical protein FO519_005462 [Halicephalobus sp. NKZ332]|nr:hypothetical protein FO519_005462 [Halicephalobus sp. NKZ332]
MASVSGSSTNSSESHLFPTVMADLNDLDGTTTLGSSTAKDDGGGLSGGAIAGIVIGVIVAILLLVLLAFFIFRKVKDRRKNHGVYRPQLEETLHAKDLPYIPPPSIEGHFG